MLRVAGEQGLPVHKAETFMAGCLQRVHGGAQTRTRQGPGGPARVNAQDFKRP